MGRLDGPLINEVQRGGTDEFGKDLKVLHHFEEGVKRLMSGFVGIELC